MEIPDNSQIITSTVRTPSSGSSSNTEPSPRSPQSSDRWVEFFACLSDYLFSKASQLPNEKKHETDARDAVTLAAHLMSDMDCEDTNVCIEACNQRLWLRFSVNLNENPYFSAEMSDPSGPYGHYFLQVTTDTGIDAVLGAFVMFHISAVLENPTFIKIKTIEY